MHVGNVTRTKAAIFFHAYKQETVRNLSALPLFSTKASSAFETDGAIFIDDKCNLANVFSGDEYINAAVRLTEETYARCLFYFSLLLGVINIPSN